MHGDICKAIRMDEYYGHLDFILREEKGSLKGINLFWLEHKLNRDVKRYVFLL